MNIFFFEDSSKSLFGGGQKISSFVLEILNDTSAQIIYCDFRKNTNLISKLDLSRNKYIYLFHNNKGLFFSFFINFFFFFVNFFRLFFIFYVQKQNLIYSPNKRSLVYSFLLYKIFGVNYFYHAHMVLQNKWYDFLIIFFLKKAKFIVCVSKFVENEYAKKGFKNITLLTNPLENRVLDKKIKIFNKNNFSIAFFGTLNKIKGVRYLLDSIKYIDIPNINFFIYGDGEELFNLKLEFGVYKNVFFMGFVSDVISKLDEVDILVLPSLIPEAAPTILQQAMSRGLPVITTNIGGQKSFIRDRVNGILVDPKNSIQISSAITTFKNDSILFDFVSRNNIADARCFDSLADFKRNVLNLFFYENSSTG